MLVLVDPYEGIGGVLVLVDPYEGIGGVLVLADPYEGMVLADPYEGIGGGVLVLADLAQVPMFALEQFVPDNRFQTSLKISHSCFVANTRRSGCGNRRRHSPSRVVVAGNLHSALAIFVRVSRTVNGLSALHLVALCTNLRRMSSQYPIFKKSLPYLV